MVCPSNFLYSILKINTKMIMFITVPLFVHHLDVEYSKKTLSHFPYLGFGTPGHRTKVVRFWANNRAHLT